MIQRSRLADLVKRGGLAALALLLLGLSVIGTPWPVAAAPADISPIVLYFPDLVVDKVEAKVIGYSTYLAITVKNRGNASAKPSTTVVKHGVLTWQPFAVPGLAPGATKLLYHKLPPFSCGGTHVREIRVDSKNAVFESNEVNNTVSYTHIYPVC